MFSTGELLGLSHRFQCHLFSVFGVLRYVFHRVFCRQWNLPPGPGYIGSLTEIPDTAKMHEDLHRLGQHYGDVFSMHFRGRLMIVLNSHDAIKEAFSNHGSNFADKPKWCGLDILHFHDEILNSPYNDKWKADRKFLCKALRASGFEPKESERIVTTEVNELINYLEKKQNLPLDLSIPVENLCGNIIHSIVLGQRFPWYDTKPWYDKSLVKFVSATRNVQRCLNSTAAFDLPLLPLFIIKRLFPDACKDAKDMLAPIRMYLEEKYEEHKGALDAKNPRGFMDRYMLERQIEGQFSQSKLVDTILALLPDAIGSVGTAILWMVKHLAAYPSEQRKLQQEIDRVCGPSRQPKYEDRRRMPQFQAFMTEVHRIVSVVPTTTMHKVSKSTTFRGFNIPAQNTVIIANLHGAHMNPRVFPNPEAFDPSRFLSDKGEFVRSDAILPFGFGRRMCMGEQLARVETFLVTASLLQKFTIKLSDERDRERLKQTTADRLQNIPTSFEVYFQHRNIEK